MSDSPKKLFLIPSTLGDTPVVNVIPAYNLEIINTLSHFVVEEIRTARRFLIRCGYKNDINSIQFYILNEHTPAQEIPSIFSNSGNHNLGLLSEAGVPGVADPGSSLVEEAHRSGIKVIPLAGPSSLILALMASGMNGQQFAFNGYLPVKEPDRTMKIRFYEKRSETEKQSQLFIEAPYRNNQLMEALLASLKPVTRLCIAMNITMENEWICTRTIHEWKRQALPDLKRQPAVFIIQG
jgi:16S rRNA (cytidine1402-2'-O)-methyltransferase